MTEPTRDALHAETLAMLAKFEVASEPVRSWFAYAAECVKRVPELEAEVEALRAFASRQNDEQNEALDRGLQVRAALDLTPTAPIGLVLARIGQLTAAYAAATREGTDA